MPCLREELSAKPEKAFQHKPSLFALTDSRASSKSFPALHWLAVDTKRSKTGYKLDVGESFSSSSAKACKSQN